MRSLSDFIPRGPRTAALLAVPGIRHAVTACDAAFDLVRRAPISTALTLAAALFLTVAIVASRSAQLVATPPAWWATASPMNAPTLALDLENQLIELAYRPSDDAWPFDASEAAVNAWITERLPSWLGHDANDTAINWPDDLDAVRVHFQQNRLIVGIQLSGTETTPPIYAATIKPRMSPEGELWIPATSVHLGSLKLPATALLSSAPVEILPDEIRDRPEILALFEALAGRRPLIERADVSLGDGRRIRIEQLTLNDGVAQLVCRTR